MSDFGQSSAIEQTNNLISQGMDNARATREHNNNVLDTYNAKIKAVNNKTDAVGVSSKTADTSETGLSGVQTLAATGREAKAAWGMGVGNYIKSQPAATAENLRGAFSAGKSALGIGTAPARGAAAAGYIPVANRTIGGARSTAQAAEEGGDMGVLPGVFKKTLGAITDLPDAQVAGIAKGLGAFTGIAGAGLTGIEDIASGSFGGSDGKDATGLQKSANVSSLVAGGLDAMALAVPILAPVAGVADVVSGIMGIAGDASGTKKAKNDAGTLRDKNTEAGDGATVSTGSAGQIASSSTQQRTY